MFLERKTHVIHGHHGSPAFTLIELLVVIGIIAILAALLFPVLNSVKEKGNATKCVSNLHQAGNAFGAYAADHNMELPVNDPNGVLSEAYRWYLVLNPYFGKSISPDSGAWAPPSIFVCPTNDPHDGDAEGGKYKLWVDYGYACNLALLPRFLGGANWYPDGWSGKDSNGNDVSYPGKCATRLVTITTRHVLISDVGKDRSQYLKAEPAKMPYDSVDNARIHSGGVNALWSDFSVSWMKAEDIVSDAGKTFCWY